MGETLQKWRVKRNARPDLLKQIKALGFELEPIVFSSQDHHRTFGYKKRIKTSTNACLPDDHPTLPGSPLGKLFRRAKK